MSRVSEVRESAGEAYGQLRSGPFDSMLVLFALNLVDELDRTAFGILIPEIREEFGLGLTGLLSLVALVSAGALAMQIPIATWADRGNRSRIALAGALLWAVFSFATGLAWAVWALVVFRIGSGTGRAVVDPTHNSLLADYYEPEARPAVFAFHRLANPVGQMLGPILAGFLAFYFGWRTPFLVFAIPTLIVVLVGAKVLREPVRGAQERRAMGASEDAVETEEAPPSFAEAWRMVWKIESLRRIWIALPFLAVSLIGFATFAALLYEEEFGLDERARGIVAAATEPAGIAGLLIGGIIGSRLIQRDPSLVLRFLAVTSFFTAGMAALFALSPEWFVTIAGIDFPWLAVLANMAISLSLATLLPGILSALAMAIPPRARAVGFSVGSLWILPGLIVLPIIGAVGDAWGIRQGMLLLVPVFLIGGLIIASAGLVINDDIGQVWTTAAAMAEVRAERLAGRSKLLLVRSLDVSYGDVQVLFGVDFEVDEGEIVALLGTNGAGKSTLLKSISGVIEADRGAVIFDGTEMTYAPSHEVAARGVLQVPGGEGVFPALTVGENLAVAGWLEKDKARRAEGVERVYDLFPALDSRRDEPAANLSGGQQQMLAIGMALQSNPRLLMIDELSLGLAPVIVEQLLPVLRRLADEGTTIILVDQSVNVALTVAETAFFMEKGEIRFHGPTAELLDRPDVLRSVFLEGAGAAVDAEGNGHKERAAVRVREDEPEVDPDAPPVLETIDLSRSFGGIRAVDGVSLQVAPGEILGLIGPNGAGKTTFFDVVTGFTGQDEGQVFVEGRDITSLSPHQRARRGLGRSFQDARLFPSLTVEEAMAVALESTVEVKSAVAAMLYLPNVYDSELKVKARVDELIELLGLEAFRSKFLRELSTGSRRIVDLACVVAHSPKVVLLDEPSSGIAQRETEALAPVLVRIREQLGASLMVIEHDMPLVTAIADRIVALDQGAVITDGTVDEVLHHPEVVASYLGTNEDVIQRSGERRS